MSVKCNVLKKGYCEITQGFGGTWEVFGTGRCLVGVDTLQEEHLSSY